MDMEQKWAALGAKIGERARDRVRDAVVRVGPTMGLRVLTQSAKLDAVELLQDFLSAHALDDAAFAFALECAIMEALPS